jgi:hypothetical protein
MRLKKDIRIVLMMMVVAHLASLCPADAKHPTVAQLLDKYTRALDSTSSFIGDWELVGHHRGDSVLGKRDGTISYRGHVRHDNQRFYYQKYMWGHVNPAFPDMPEDTPIYNCSIINGRDKRAYYHRKSHEVPGKVSRLPYSKENVPITITPGLSYLIGYINSDERLDSVLRQADRIIVRETTEKVGDSDCFVLEADTKYGRYKLWLDPEHGFHPAKMRQSASAKEGNYRHSKKMTEGTTTKAYLDNVRFEKIDGIWVPMEADGGSDTRLESGRHERVNGKWVLNTQTALGEFSTFDYHYKRTDIILNPDHDELGSFADPIFEEPSNDPELMNGTRVRLSGLPIQYTWQDGELVDKYGNKVDMEKIHKKANNACK